MAITQNPILQGLSGKLGKVVLRQLNGKTVVQSAPVRKAPATSGELANRKTFRKAVEYASQARLNTVLKEVYSAEAKRRGGNSNWFAVAVSDYRNGLKLAKNVQKPVQPAKIPASPQAKAFKLHKQKSPEPTPIHTLERNAYLRFPVLHPIIAFPNPATMHPP